MATKKITKPLKRKTAKKPPFKKTGGGGTTTKGNPTDAKKFAEYQAAGGKLTSTSAAQIGYRTPAQSKAKLKEARRNSSGIPEAKSPTPRKKTVTKKKKK